MSKLTLKHKITLIATGVLWLIWIIYTVACREIITADPDQGRQFGIMFAVSAVVYGLLFMPIVHPDMNYIPKNVHDNNRELLFKSRRTMYCFLQLILVFVLGGTSISLFYKTWRIGVGVVVGLFAAFVIADIVVYMLECKKYFAIPAPAVETAEDAPEK